MTKQEKIREGMAERAHLTWQRWMAYMFTHLDEEHSERWKRQASTAYKDLSEEEKESDRSIADEHFRYLHSQGVVIKVGGISEDLAETASQCETYYADRVGMSWERDNYVFRAFKEAGYVAVEPLIREVKDEQH